MSASTSRSDAAASTTAWIAAAVPAHAGTGPRHGPSVETRNLAAVADFHERFFNAQDLDTATEVIRHAASPAAGRRAFVHHFTRVFQQNPGACTSVVRMAAEGDLVWVHHHLAAAPDGLGQDVIDIYRVRDGKLAEHWNALVPASKARAGESFHAVHLTS